MDTTTTPAPASLDVQATPLNPVRLSNAAVTQVKEVIKAQGFEGYFFSIRVVPAGCSGLGYDLNLVKEAKPNDHVWEQDGVKITTDALSSKYLLGTVVDFVSSVTGAGFKFENPNAKSSCGCGTSFST
ncbi:HesB/IscA family protein [Stigmatella aurantiaca]|uniref:HesB/YadR/YfhF family protein n=1 Tax=Stigmatella aurantiaca (strain DW4/3-1) TaxID=378806 RepID=Q08X49_STIAD|nr:iron-sulfur cluster assembly accessory protein [Stigmatella aurantiaca]ADO71114.1 HesB/YadR/YfhF family protein [Stigmatella aurantiaca DW4/3-1]EAU65065.1 IscA protein [Stigmatella aurantiaca DW4/3-1]